MRRRRRLPRREQLLQGTTAGDRRALLAVAPAHREGEQTLGPPKPLPPPSPPATKGEKTLRFLGFLVWPPDSDLLLRARLDGCHRVFGGVWIRT
jgi:hypothetical protein